MSLMRKIGHWFAPNICPLCGKVTGLSAQMGAALHAVTCCEYCGYRQTVGVETSANSAKSAGFSHDILALPRRRVADCV